MVTLVFILLLGDSHAYAHRRLRLRLEEKWPQAPRIGERIAMQELRDSLGYPPQVSQVDWHHKGIATIFLGEHFAGAAEQAASEICRRGKWQRLADVI